MKDYIQKAGLFVRPIEGEESSVCTWCGETFTIGVIYKFWKGSQENGYCLNCLAIRFNP